MDKTKKFLSRWPKALSIGWNFIPQGIADYYLVQGPASFECNSWGTIYDRLNIGGIHVMVPEHFYNDTVLEYGKMGLNDIEKMLQTDTYCIAIFNLKT